MRRVLRSLGMAVLAFGLAGTAQADERFVRVGGGVTGTYPLFGAKLSQLINDNIADVRASVVPGDSEPAQVMLETGELDFNIAYTWLTKKIYDGKGGLGIPTPKARHVITLYGSALQIIARPDTITNLAQLTEDRYRVWVGPESFIFSQLVKPTIEAHGITLEDIRAAGGVTETMGYAAEVQAFQDGKLDVGFFAGGVPYGLLQQVERAPGFTLIGLDAPTLARLAELLPGIDGQVIPAGTYAGQDEDVLAPHFVNHLVTSAEVPEALVYQVTKLMYERYAEFHGLFPGAEEIDAEEPLANNRLPLHPGAERFYREVGVIE